MTALFQSRRLDRFMANVAAYAVGALALVVAGVACAADRVVVQLDWLPSGDKAAFYVGSAQGFYAEEGLDVVILSGRGATDALSKLATGAADVGSSNFSNVLSGSAQNNLPVKAVYSYFTELPDAFLTVRGNGITSVKDLAGHKVGATALSGSRVIMPLVFEANGMKLTDVNLQIVDPNVLVPMLASGRIEAISAFRTQSSLAESMLREQGKQMVVLPWASFGLTCYGTVVVASDKFIEQRPDVLKRFLKAFQKSVDFAIAQPDAAGTAVKKAAPEVDEKIAAAQFRLAIPLIRNATTTRDGMGLFSTAMVQESWKLVARSENLPLDKFQPMSVIYRDARSAK